MNDTNGAAADWRQSSSSFSDEKILKQTLQIHPHWHYRNVSMGGKKKIIPALICPPFMNSLKPLWHAGKSSGLPSKPASPLSGLGVNIMIHPTRSRRGNLWVRLQRLGALQSHIWGQVCGLLSSVVSTFTWLALFVGQSCRWWFSVVALVDGRWVFGPAWAVELNRVL